jgi:hypothetical protein
VRLIVQIKAIGDELFKLDIDGSIEGPSAAEAGTAAFAALASTISASIPTFSATGPSAFAGTSIASSFPTGPIAAARAAILTTRLVTSLRTRTAAALRTRLRPFLFRRLRFRRLRLGSFGFHRLRFRSFGRSLRVCGRRFFGRLYFF